LSTVRRTAVTPSIFYLQRRCFIRVRFPTDVKIVWWNVSVLIKCETEKSDNHQDGAGYHHPLRILKFKEWVQHIHRFVFSPSLQAGGRLNMSPHRFESRCSKPDFGSWLPAASGRLVSR
jgi:hypothetical protein